MRTAYVTAKQGVMGVTQNLARELGPSNIRCNAILPGLIDNERGRSIVSNYARENKTSNEKAEADFLKYISMKSWINPSEIGDTVVFLASNAGRHISGQFLAVDGNFEWEA
jgi:NAD(P)-dependent dehydrogenase (short-subunit alcohol dehydrogenase family)